MELKNECHEKIIEEKIYSRKKNCNEQSGPESLGPGCGPPTTSSCQKLCQNGPTWPWRTETSASSTTQATATTARSSPKMRIAEPQNEEKNRE